MDVAEAGGGDGGARTMMMWPAEEKSPRSHIVDSIVAKLSIVCRRREAIVNRNRLLDLAGRNRQ